MSLPWTLLDLTHTLNAKTPSWNGSCGFSETICLDYSKDTEKLSFRVQQLKMHAGIGTHLDAPAHCVPGGATVESISLEQLIVPACVMDVSFDATEDYLLSLEALLAFEAEQGAIEAGSLFLLHTGWSRFWEEAERYRNQHQFPAISEAAAEHLLKRGCVGLGIDTLSPDRPDSGFPVHRLFLGAGCYLLENLTNLEQLPPKGAIVAALPIKAAECTEAPARVVALLPDKD